MPAVEVRQGELVASVPLQVRLVGRIVVRRLVDCLAPRMVGRQGERLAEALLQVQDQSVVVGAAPASIEVVLQDQRVVETHDRPALLVRAGLVDVGIQGPDDVHAAVVVVGRRERVAADFALDFEAALLGVRVDRILGDTEGDAQGIARAGVDSVNREILARDASRPDYTARLLSLPDLRRCQRLAGESALDPSHAGERDEDLINLLCVAQQVIDVGDLPVNASVVDAVASANHRLGIGTPSESRARRDVVVVAWEPGLDLELMAQPERELQFRSYADRVLKENFGVRGHKSGKAYRRCGSRYPHP